MLVMHGQIFRPLMTIRHPSKPLAGVPVPPVGWPQLNAPSAIASKAPTAPATHMHSGQGSLLRIWRPWSRPTLTVGEQMGPFPWDDEASRCSGNHPVHSIDLKLPLPYSPTYRGKHTTQPGILRSTNTLVVLLST